jgi:hypothetical protein
MGTTISPSRRISSPTPAETHDDQTALGTAHRANHESSTTSKMLRGGDRFHCGLHRGIKFLGTLIHHARSLALSISTVAVAVVLAPLDAERMAEAHDAQRDNAGLTSTVLRAIDLTTEARPAEVEHLRALAAPDLDCDLFAHHLGGEELDDATELRENDLVDRTLRPPR